MKIYQIVLTETLERVFEVEAETAGEAVENIARKYANFEINLNSGDMKDFSIREKKE